MSWESRLDVELFWRQGFLWLPGFADEAEVAALRGEMDRMLNEWAPPLMNGSDDGSSKALDSGTATNTHPVAPTGPPLSPMASASSLRPPQPPMLREQGSPQAAGTEKTQAPPDHSFMLNSATKASFFLEPGALDGNGALQPGMSKRQAVRKVAHGIHLFEGPWRDFVQSPKVARVAHALGWRRPAVVQTLYRLASAQAVGVDRHQDSTTLYTEPPSCLGMWLALEDADESNGCLRVRRGSHREPIRERLVRTGCEQGDGGAGDEGANEDAGGEGRDCQARLVFKRLVNATRQPDDAFSPLQTSSGDLLVMHGALEHFSERGQDPRRSRESLQVHIVEAGAKWPADNWLQYPAGMRFDELTPPPTSKPSVFSEL